MRSIGKILTLSIIVVIIVIVITLFTIRVLSKGSKECNIDEDCFVYGEAGTCTCGCYSKKPLIDLKEKCFCGLPEACACIDNICQGV